MGILNVTPDSFSDGGHFFSVEDAVKQAASMIASGAAIIDVGGESTRPGAQAVSVDEERRRVIPVIEQIYDAFPDTIISIDTSKPEIMTDAISAGARLVND
ncbi:dihydropteroate synthase, partial [Kaarinaea lacus]